MISGKVYLKVVTSVDPSKATAIFIFISVHEVTAYSQHALPTARQFEAPDLSSTSFAHTPVTGSSSAISRESTPEPGSMPSAEPVAQPAVALPTAPTLEAAGSAVPAATIETASVVAAATIGTVPASTMAPSADQPQAPTSSSTASTVLTVETVTTDPGAAVGGNGDVASQVVVAESDNRGTPHGHRHAAADQSGDQCAEQQRDDNPDRRGHPAGS